MKKIKSNIGLVEIFVPLIYLLSEYKIFGGTLAMYASAVMIIYLLAKNRFKVRLYEPLVTLFIFLLIHDMLKVFLVNVSIGLWIERVLYFAVIILIIGKVDEVKLYKVWSTIGIIAIIGMLYHSYQVYFLHNPVTQIKILPFDFSDMENAYLAYYRPRSIFSEPAAYVSWIAPLLYLSLKNGKMLFSIIITLSMLLSTSSVGVIMVVISWGYILLSERINMNKERKIMILIIMIIGVYIVLSVGIFSDTINKITGISLSNGSDYSRVLLGIMLFIDAPLKIKLFGIPYTSVQDYLLYGNVDLIRYSLSSEYSFLGFVNAFGNCLINYGFFAILLYLRFYYRMWRDINKDMRGYFIICIFSILSQSVFFNTYFIIQVAVLLGTSSKYLKND